MADSRLHELSEHGVSVWFDTLSRELLAMSQAEFSAAFKGSPLKRAKRRRLARNAAVALGNAGSADDVPALRSLRG